MTEENRYIVTIEFFEEYEIEAPDEGEAEAIAMERLNEKYPTKDDVFSHFTCDVVEKEAER